MEVLAYILISLLTFVGVTSLPTRRILILGSKSSEFVNFFPIVGAIIIWNIIDIIHLSILNTPIPITLFLICWLVKLVEDSLIKKADWQINVGMAEAWVLFIWEIISMFGDYRAWF